MTEQITAARLREDLAAVVRDAEALIKASASEGGAKASEAQAKIRASIDAAKTRLHDAEHAALHKGEDAVRSAEDYAKRNPWQAMGIAAGVGLVFGVLLSRR
jgi:ElaB/YqjD/DUF883 family membrane-anchored ribosome-binding protein